MPERDRKKKIVLSIFFLLKLIIPQSLFCLKCTSPNYFIFLFPPYLPTSPHCVAGCFLSYDSTASSSLTGSFIPLSPLRHPSFAFSSSLFLFITDCRLQPVHFQRIPWSWSSFTTETFCRQNLGLSLLYHWNLKVNRFLWPFAMCVAACYVCGCMWGNVISTGEGSNHVGFRRAFVAACGTCNSRYS